MGTKFNAIRVGDDIEKVYVDFSSYESLTTSGEQYKLVPTIPLNTLFFFLFKYREQPKSISLTSFNFAILFL